jgi:hypothetical protein
VKILFDYSTEAGIKECKIIAENDRDETRLMEVREKIIEILESPTTVELTKEGSDSCTDQNDPEVLKELLMTERAAELFKTGGC